MYIGLIVFVLLLLVVFFVVGTFYMPELKGLVGEGLVIAAMFFTLDRKTYRRLNNVILPTVDGTTQIDHIIIATTGVFVVETKNMQGWIFGREREPYWTQRLRGGSFKFQNPLRQNFKHVAAVRALLDVDESVIHSVVVFVGDSTFKTPMPPHVTTLRGFVDYVKAPREPVLSAEAINTCLQQLQSQRVKVTVTSQRAHAKHVQTIVASRSSDSSAASCPRCGGALVTRTTKRGARADHTFVGCSNFPRCRYTRSAEPDAAS